MADEAHELLDKLAKRPANLEAMHRASIALDMGRLAFDMRSARDLTQGQLAARIGTSRTVISRLEGGNAGHVPGLDQLQKIAQACGFQVRLEAVSVRPCAGLERPDKAKLGFALSSASTSSTHAAD